MNNNLAQQNALIADNLIFACVNDEVAANYIVSKINPDDFIFAEHRAMLQNIKSLVLAGEPVTADRVVLGVNGGVERFNHIIETTLSSANYEYYTQVALDMACRRHIGEMLSEISTLSASEETSSSDILTALETKLSVIKTPIAADNAPQNAREITRDWLTLMKERMAGGQMKGLSTGYDELDKIISGLQGRLYVLAGRPGSGKSAFALNIALNISKSHKVLFISLEMAKDEVMDRAVANLSGVFLSNIENGFNDIQSSTEKAKQSENMRLALPHFTSGNLTIWDNTDISIADLTLECQRLKRAEGVDLIVVDYLGLMVQNSGNEVDELGQISRALKNLSAKINTPIIALHQVNRECEKRNDKRPKMGDLRGSGKIEENANVVMFTYRDDYYEKDYSLHTNVLEVIIDKNRSGKKGLVKLDCDLSRMRIREFLTPFDGV